MVFVCVFLPEHKEKEAWNQKQWEDLVLKVQCFRW